MKFDLFTGDVTGLAIPAHSESFRAAGAAFLTRAFRTFGALGEDNAVARIVSLEPCPGGSTGAKLFMTIEYARPDPGLHTELFVKFSRDFDDPRRDWQKTEMESEAPFMAISRLPGFPIRVPCAYFADYAAETGTGLVITERVAYGEGRIEPHRRKCMDHLTMPESAGGPLPYYRAVVTALGRLAGAHKSGRLAPDIEVRFPFDPVTGSADPIRYSEEELRAELERCSSFSDRMPQLLPEAVRTAEFRKRMELGALAARRNEAAIQGFLTSDPRMIALCHWNAHVDNCIFWREGEPQDDEVRCGFIDWGRVGQITFGSILWGALSAAHHDIWDKHLDELLTLFLAEYEATGGPRVTLDELHQHLALHMAAMGVARVLAFPEIIEFRLPECIDAEGPYDPMFHPVEVDAARNCRQVYANFLQHWRRQDFGARIDRMLANS